MSDSSSSEIPNSSDCISRQAAIDAINNHFGFNIEEEYGSAVQEVINGLPSAQPEIIKCKDCKHLQKWRSEESANKFGQIYECSRNVLDCPKPKDFCSHAERRTDG